MTHLTARVRQKNYFFLPDIFRIFRFFSKFRPIFSLRLGKIPYGRPKNPPEQNKSILVEIKKIVRFPTFGLGEAPLHFIGGQRSTSPDSAQSVTEPGVTGGWPGSSGGVKKYFSQLSSKKKYSCKKKVLQLD
jgi:hypothetical protein